MDTFHISKLVLVIIGILISIGVVAYILRATTLAQQGATREQFEKDKLMQGFKLFFAFIGIGTFAFVMIAFIINHNKNRTTSSGVGNVIQKQEINYDSVMKEYLESRKMSLLYKSKEYKSGIYKKGTIRLDYNEDNNDRYLYILTDSLDTSEVDFSDHDYIINYFFDVPKGTSEQIYKYLNLCIENELSPKIIISNNNTSLQIMYDNYQNAGEKVEYIFTKYNNRELDTENSIKIYHYGLNDIKKEDIKLYNLIFGNHSYTKKELDVYNEYIVK